MVFPTRLQQGTIVEQRYHIERRIGSGGMSHVYLAHDLKLPGKQWAIKETVSLPSKYREAAAEARMLTTLVHPCLPRIVDYIQNDPDGYTYLVMDYIDGDTLEHKFQMEPHTVDGEFIMRCGDQLLSVLEYLHQHNPPIVFRDMKPSNVMITSQGEIRLIDFGIARTFKPDENQDTVKLGTVGFAAPEQYGSGQTDHRSDLYGLGALLLYLCTAGQYSEWKSEVESSIRSDVKPAFIQVLRRLLQYSPANRFQSASEARTALHLAIGHPAAHAGSDHPSTMLKWNKTTQVIALIGATPGTGTTHTAVSIAHYLARLGHKVALVEMNSYPGAFARIQQVALQGMTDQERLRESRRFELEGVDYWREAARAEVVSLLSGSYHFLILDLGGYQRNHRLEEFLRADLPLVVGSGAEWRYQDILNMVHDLRRYSQEKWQYCLPLAQEEAVQRLQRELGNDHVYGLPAQPDPFDRQQDMDELLTILLRNYLPSIPRKKRFRFHLSLF